MDATIRQRETPLASPSLTNPPCENESRKARSARSPHAPKRRSESRGGLRTIGVAVTQLARPIIARRGGGTLVRLKAEWGAIVGPEWAEVSWPNALGRDGALKLRIVPAAALELQHRAPLMIERINLFFGRAAITRLALVQGPLPLRAAPIRRTAHRLAPAEEQTIDEAVSKVADPDLRDALARLGRAVVGSGR